MSVIKEGELFTGDSNDYIGLIYKANEDATEPDETPGGQTHSIVFYDQGETRDEFPIATLSEDLKNPDRLSEFVRLIRDTIRQEYST
jgi:hypothetical protein